MEKPDTTAQNPESGKEVAKQGSRFSATYWMDRIYRPKYLENDEYIEISEWFVRIQHGGRRSAVGLSCAVARGAVLVVEGPARLKVNCLIARRGRGCDTKREQTWQDSDWQTNNAFHVLAVMKPWFGARGIDSRQRIATNSRIRSAGGVRAEGNKQSNKCNRGVSRNRPVVERF